MKSLIASLLLFTCVACDVQSPPPVSTSTASPAPSLLPYVERHVWKQQKPDPWTAQYAFACLSTGRIDDAHISVDGTTHMLFSRGAYFGDYDSLESAKRAGEQVVRERGFECPQ